MAEQEPVFNGLFGNELAFESYGVRVKLMASDRDLLGESVDTARRALVGNFRVLEKCDAEHSFGIGTDASGETLFLVQNGVQASHDTKRERFFKFFDSLVRIAVAEHSVDWVFIHAGVVARNGKAIVIPGHSFSGKTTLVSELVKQGASYFSDEYAVLDAKGMVHPFARDLSLRFLEGSTIREERVAAGDLGGVSATDPARIGLVVLTEYQPDGVWRPERLTLGRGLLEVIPHTISRNFNAEFSLNVLNVALRDAIILRGSRGDAAELAIKLLSFF